MSNYYYPYGFLHASYTENARTLLKKRTEKKKVICIIKFKQRIKTKPSVLDIIKHKFLEEHVP